MVQEFDYCEQCGGRKSIYTEIYRGKDLCKKCRKQAEKAGVPITITERDIIYTELLRKAKLGGYNGLY